VGFEADGNFTWERFDERYVADLADGLGNLASRSLAMLAKYREGLVSTSEDTTSLDQAGLRTLEQYAARMDMLDLRGGLEAIWSLVNRANQFIVEIAPWALAKEGKEEDLDTALGTLARCLYRLALMTGPFMPKTAARLWDALGQDQGATAAWENGVAPPVGGSRTRRVEALFPKEKRD
jgi:methionyl-tRNA synthetase